MSSYVDKLDITQKQLRFLHKQFKEIIDEKVRTALPESSEDDQISQEIQLQLDQFLMDVLEMAGESMNVVDAGKGTTVKSVIQEVQKEYTEPFDVELNEKVRKLYQEWEDETVKVSKLRREAPQVAVSEYTKQENQLLEEIDSLIAKMDSSQPNLQNEDQDEGQSEGKKKEYWNQVANQYGSILTSLKEINDKIPTHESKQKRLRLLLDLIEKEVVT
ncbi:Nsl1 [Kluyveromyces lactis]|nr:Nsl1 [Kluyveromyces lactis]